MDPLGDIMGTSAGPNKKGEKKIYFSVKRNCTIAQKKKVKNRFILEAYNNKMISSSHFWCVENALCHHTENKIIVQ